MENSRSKNSRKTSSNKDKGEEEIVTSFGKLGLEEKDHKFPVSEVIREKNNECSSEEREIHQIPASVEIEQTPAFAQPENTWAATPNIYDGMTRPQNYHSSVQNPIANYQSDVFYQSGNHTMNGYRNFYDGMTLPQNYHSSGQNPIANYQSDVFYQSGNHTMNGYRNFSPVMGGQFSGDQMSQIRNSGYYMNNNIANLNYSPYHQVPQDHPSLQQENCFLTIARTRAGSEKLQELLQQGNYFRIQKILNEVLGSIFELMIDDNGHHVFGMLIEKCTNDQVFLIASELAREPDTFIYIAITDTGSKSIQRLIKKLEETPMAKIITRMLSRGPYQLMIHKTGSHVIQQCFIHFGEEPNRILYEAIRFHLLRIAADPVGCISLYSFLDSITGTKKLEILYDLANNSLFLANDPSGNFVVQRILDRNDISLTSIILLSLENHFTQLAPKQGGSHIVEKCMKSCSEYGLGWAVEDLLKDGKELARLACDQFGNYVIQTALKLTKISDKTRYHRLLRALLPYYQKLMGKARGKHVAELIREDLGIQEANADE